MFQILKLLRQLGHRVTFIPDNLANIPPYTGELQNAESKWFIILMSRKCATTSFRMAPNFDAVVLSRCDFARKHIADVRLHAPQSRIIFDTVDLHYLREDSEAQLTGDPEVRRKAQEKQRLEHELIDQADETWVVSPVEQQLLQEKWPEKSIQLVSNIVDIPGSKHAVRASAGLAFHRRLPAQTEHRCRSLFRAENLSPGERASARCQILHHRRQAAAGNRCVGN